MKKIGYLLFLFIGLAHGQIVNIPDANFKLRLLQSNTTNQIGKDINGNSIVIDVNNDGEIQVTEAQLVYTLTNLNYASSFPIYNLTGIQSFTNLRELYCGSHNLTTLDVSNMLNLRILFCDNGNLTNLNLTGCSNLYQIVLENNQITAMDLSGFSLLTSVYCRNNQIQSVNLTGTTSLSSVDFGNNLLTTIDVSSCTSLFSLYLEGNDLTSINFGAQNPVQSVYVHNNNLPTIDVSNLTELSYLNCSNNLLTTVDVSNNHNFTTLICTDNPNLVSVFMKFGRPNLIIGNGYPLTNNPNLQYVCMDDYRIQGFLDYFAQNGMTNVVVNSYCSFTPGGDFNTITGSMTFDANNNGCDSTDLPQPNIKIALNDGTNLGATFTNNAGNYNFYTQSGFFNLIPSVENPSWFIISPPSSSALFTNTNNNVNTQNFCITANGVHPDVEIVITPITPARPGFEAVYKLVYKNKGNQIVDASLSFNYNENVLDFVSSSMASFTSGDGFRTWNVASLLPFQSGSIIITLHVNSPIATPPVAIGDVLTFSSLITILNDENLADNSFNYNQTVVGSFDPNDITCLEGAIVSPSEIGNYLHYVINFENTGTFEAENIVVKTTIDPAKYDINSLQMLATSHNAYIRQSGDTVEFIFENIALESGGHGNVLLKIKSKSNLENGDSVSKRADIFFDYNAPIDTGIANTTFQLLNNPDFEVDNSISIYPNPTSSIINIKCDFNIQSVQLYDVQGRLLQTQIIDDTQTAIDISQKSNGIYFLKITSDKGTKVERAVKQ